MTKLERSAPPPAGCPRCRDWKCVILYEGDPEPVTQCAGCGRSRPADLFVVRFVQRDDGPQ